MDLFHPFQLLDALFEIRVSMRRSVPMRWLGALILLSIVIFPMAHACSPVGVTLQFKNKKNSLDSVNRELLAAYVAANHRAGSTPTVLISSAGPDQCRISERGLSDFSNSAPRIHGIARQLDALGLDTKSMRILTTSCVGKPSADLGALFDVYLLGGLPPDAPVCGK